LIDWLEPKVLPKALVGRTGGWLDDGLKEKEEEEKKKQAEEKRNPRPGLSPGHLRFLLLYKGVRLMVILEFNHETYF
jgi:hypothetical protein